MNKAEFANQYHRLSRGFSRDGDVTQERLMALFDTLGHYAEEDMREGVSQCLRSDRFPSFATLHASIERASDRKRASNVKVGDADARRAMLGPLIAIPDAAAMVGVRAYQELCRQAWDADVGPSAIMPAVEDLARRYPFLAVEVPLLRAMGDEWLNAQGERTGGGERPARASYDEEERRNH